MKNISNKTVTISKEEYDGLKKIEKDFIQLLDEETCFYKDTIEIFKEENLTLKKELYPLADRISALEKSRDSIFEKIQQDQNLILRSIQRVEDSLGSVTSV